MPFVLVLVGILMIVTGAQGTYAAFASQIGKDFTGPGNFLYWVLAITIVGAVGYIQSLQNVSRLFIGLIIISMFLANKGFFAQFTNALKKGPQTPPPGLSLGATAPTSPTSSAGSSGVMTGIKGMGLNLSNPFGS